MGAIQDRRMARPIVLFVEHQTTGGYPKPANVISADFLAPWAKLRPRDAAAVRSASRIERAR